MHPHWILSQFSEVQVSPSADALTRSAGGFTRTQDLGDFLQFNAEKVRVQCGRTGTQCGRLGLSAGGLTRTGDLADFLRSYVLGPVRMAHPQCG